MALTPVPIIDPGLGDAPDPADEEAVFEADAYDFTSRMPGFGGDIKAIGDATYANAQWAEAKAGESAASAGNAATSETNAGLSATAAAGSAVSALTLVEKYLDVQATDPTAGRGGAPLVDGNWCINSVSGFIRAYTIAGGWVNGVSAVAGVSSLNGLTGAVTSPSQAEAEAGTEATKPMSALRTAQAIAALAPPSFSTGDTLATTRALASPNWLPANGDVYLQSSYASLFASVGLSNFFDPGTKLSNPSTLPPGDGNGCAFSPSGTYLAVAHASSPFLTIYKRSGDVFTKLTNPVTLPNGTGNGCSFSSDGVYLAVANNTSSSPSINIYKRSGDAFTKLADPAALPEGNGRGCAFSSDGVYLAVAHTISPYITIYKRSGDVFTKLTNPVTLPNGTGNGCSFSSDGAYLSVAHATFPFVTIYKRSGDVFTKLANPAALPEGTGNGCAFSPDVVHLCVAHSVNPCVAIYKRNGDVFTKLDNPAVLPIAGASGLSCAFSQDGNYLCVSNSDGLPNFQVYRRSGDAFIKQENPAIPPASNGRGCDFAPDSSYLSISHSATPFVTIYGVGYDKATQFKLPNLRRLGINAFIKT